MAVRNVVQRGYGAGASIPFVVLRGYSTNESVATLKTQIPSITGKSSTASGYVVSGITGKAEPV